MKTRENTFVIKTLVTFSLFEYMSYSEIQTCTGFYFIIVMMKHNSPVDGRTSLFKKTELLKCNVLRRDTLQGRTSL